MPQGSLELQLLGRSGLDPYWARGYVPYTGQPITGSQNPGPTKPKPTNQSPKLVEKKQGLKKSKFAT